MIEGRTKTEALYRAINLDSSSSLKEFSMDRKKYHRKYVLGESVDDKDTQAAVMGRIVETLLMEPHEFDNRFYMSVCLAPPTGLMLSFVEALYKHTTEATDENGRVSRDFAEIAKDAYTDSGFKIKFDAVISKFQGSDAEVYYNELREVKGKGLTVATTQDVENAEKIVTELRTNDITAHVVNLVNSARYTVQNQLQIEGYDVNGHQFKSMMDKVVIDHKEQTIQVYDLKCTWSVENFLEEYYLYRRAYIQAYLYFHAAMHMKTNNEELSEYNVIPPKFIVCDSTNYFSPLIYTLSHDDLDDAYNGFEHKGKLYTGVKNIIEDLKWALESNVWNISRKNYLAGGQINIRSNYERKENDN
jgi:hypothetical protein